LNAAAPRRRPRMILVWLLVAGATAYIAVVVLLAANQQRLIYPAPPPQHAPAGFVPVTLRTADGLTITAGYRPARNDRPTVLFFHGNGMVWPDGIYVTDRLAARGYGLLLAEYRGYNGNPGKPSEEGLYQDARAALAWLEGQGVPGSEIVLAGLSVGSGPAVQLATEFRPRALLLISPLASLPETAAAAYPWLPVRWLIRDRYDNLAKLARVDAPVLIVHGEADTLIPVSHAQRLARVSPHAEFVAVPGRGHNMAAEPGVQQVQLQFLERLR
jgi:fermentation-respiration switch protein FrsA (DUF1100 family)